MAAPSGTVTFLFTDIEGSTRLWEVAPSAMRQALERHDDIVRATVDAHGGYVFATGGDGFAAAFTRAGDAITAGLAAQAALVVEPWPDGAPIRVRMAAHTGEVAERDGDYFGGPVNEAARLMALAHGGQFLCSAVTAALVRAEVALTDLGEHRLRDLSSAQRVFQVGGGAFPALRSPDAVPGNLPSQLSSFVGREAALADVAGLVGVERLVTLTGPGGVGKTRLAVHVGADVAAQFPDGVWFVDLASVSDREQIAASVLAVLGLPQQTGRSLWSCVCDGCRHRRALMVVDNCEHLLDDVVPMVAELLDAAPDLRVLATSREALALPGERTYPVQPLRAEDEAVDLFTDRAVAVRPGFVVTDDNSEAVRAVCRHLDGMPLAVELAAARVGAMSPAEIAARLDDRFRLLGGGRRVRVERHQTLRAAIDWSHDLLSDVDQRVFGGGCTADAAQAVLTDDTLDPWEVLDALASLTAKSLLSAVEDTGVMRYSMLETVRRYALERLAGRGGIDELREAHLAWAVGFVRQVGDGVRGPDEAQWLRRLASERDNIVAAVEWAVDTADADRAARLIAPIAWHVQSNAQLGLADLPAKVLGIDGIEGHTLFSAVSGSAAWSRLSSGDPEGANELSLRAYAAEGAAPVVIARTIRTLALHYLGRVEEATRLAEDTISRAAEIPDEWERVLGYLTAAVLRVDPGADLERLSDVASAALPIAQRLQNPTALFHALFLEGMSAIDRDPRSAIPSLEGSLEAAARVGTQQLLVIAVLGMLSRCYSACRDVDEVGRCIHDGVSHARAAGSPGMLAQIMDYGAQALVSLGYAEEGAVFEGAVASGRLAPRSAGGVELQYRAEAQRVAEERLGPDRYARASERGAAFSAEEATAYALAVADAVRQNAAPRQPLAEGPMSD